MSDRYTVHPHSGIVGGVYLRARACVAREGREKTDHE